MATTLAETYYLKALENYPWELSEVMENLTYSLSYDDSNPAANCLMGKLQMNQLKNYPIAEEYFNKSISSNPDFGCAYENLVMLYIRIGKLKKAQQVLDYSQRISTVSRSFILRNMALILEKQGQLRFSKKYLKSALAEVVCPEEHEQLDQDLNRVKAKLKAQRKVKAKLL